MNFIEKFYNNFLESFAQSSASLAVLYLFGKPLMRFVLDFKDSNFVSDFNEEFDEEFDDNDNEFDTEVNSEDDETMII